MAKNDGKGNRIVEMMIEVPGTPEQVWQAIATGPGFTAWFTPTEIEEHVGGKVVFDFGSMGQSLGKVTAFEPPRRFACVEPDWKPGAPPCATEITIEARAGGTCTLRMVNSLYTSETTWDSELDGFEKGWQTCFEILKRYLANFPGMRCSTARLSGASSQPADEVWDALATAVQLKDAKVGEQRTLSAAGLPSLTGKVERIESHDNHHELLMLMDAPARGFAVLGTYYWGGQSLVALTLFLYGDQAPADLAKIEPAWRQWLNERYSGSASV